MNYYVEIVKSSKEHVETVSEEDILRSMGPMTEYRAGRVECGVNINLDHDRFYTRIIEKEF